MNCRCSNMFKINKELSFDKILVYIAGPYSGNEAIHVRKAMDIATQLINSGFAVIVPHLSHFLHIVYPKDYQVWMDQSFELLKRCDVMYMISSSPGADAEKKLAYKLKIPVYDNINVLIANHGDIYEA